MSHNTGAFEVGHVTYYAEFTLQAVGMIFIWNVFISSSLNGYIFMQLLRAEQEILNSSQKYCYNSVWKSFSKWSFCFSLYLETFTCKPTENLGKSHNVWKLICILDLL